MDYEPEIKRLKDEINQTLQNISERLVCISVQEPDPSIGYLLMIVDELDKHVKVMNAKLYTAMYLNMAKNGKEK